MRSTFLSEAQALSLLGIYRIVANICGIKLHGWAFIARNYGLYITEAVYMYMHVPIIYYSRFLKFVVKCRPQLYQRILRHRHSPLYAIYSL